MLFYQEDKVTNRLSKEIESQIGASISLKEQLRNGTVGSGLYYLRKLTICDEKAKNVNLNAHCIFEKYKHGLLLRINDHQKLYSVAIPFQSIDHFEMSPGKEYIKPFPLSPMWILLKLRIPIRYAAIFMIDLLENRADPMILRISSGLDFIELHANAKNYKSEKKYFGQIIEKYLD